MVAGAESAVPLRNLIYAGLAAQKLRRHFRDFGESGALEVVSMVLYHGAGPWNAPTTADDPDAACAEDVPALVLGLLVPSQTTRELERGLDALACALEPVTDPRLRERIARQLRPVLASMYDHPLLKKPSSMATMLEVFAEARDAERTRDRNEGRKEGRLEGQSRVVARQATLRFGPETAWRVTRLIAGVTDAVYSTVKAEGRSPSRSMLGRPDFSVAWESADLTNMILFWQGRSPRADRCDGPLPR